MSDVCKLLYQGQLPAAVATLATVPSSPVISWIVKHWIVVNNDTVARTFALYRQGTAATNIITPPAVSVPAGGCVEWDGTMSMGTGETLRGVGSVATMLTLTVDGDEVS